MLFVLGPVGSDVVLRYPTSLASNTQVSPTDPDVGVRKCRVGTRWIGEAAKSLTSLTATSD